MSLNLTAECVALAPALRSLDGPFSTVLIGAGFMEPSAALARGSGSEHNPFKPVSARLQKPRCSSPCFQP